ncbi:MAG: bifunctional nuclease family protein [Chthoniobacterales bacterium]
MSKAVVEVHVKALIPTNGGCAVFIGNSEKLFVIHVDPSVGSAIAMFMSGQKKERPLTHDLMALLLSAVGAKVERIVINDLKDGTYFGRLIITAENEIHQRKIIELDARPSDCIALASQQNAKIYVSAHVWDEVDDMSEVLEEIKSDDNSTEEDDPDLSTD